MEYNSYAFGGLLHSRVYIPVFKKHTVRYNVADGKQIPDKDDPGYPSFPVLDIEHGPGGVQIGASMTSNQILINYPIDATLTASGNPSVFDIKPEKGLKVQKGANTFVIGGANFNSIKGARRSDLEAFGRVQAACCACWIVCSVQSMPLLLAGPCCTLARLG
jgi:hypothetical protein